MDIEAMGGTDCNGGGTEGGRDAIEGGGGRRPEELIAGAKPDVEDEDETADRVVQLIDSPVARGRPPFFPFLPFPPFIGGIGSSTSSFGIS